MVGRATMTPDLPSTRRERTHFDAQGEPCSCGGPAPLAQTPPPMGVPGAWFDQAAVDKVVAALRALPHVQGRRFAGKPLELAPYQLEHLIAPVFGWKHPDGTRIVRVVWFEVPRKSGKSTISAGIAIILVAADGEIAAEVYAAGPDKKIARRLVAAANEMARGCKHLRGRIRPQLDALIVPRTRSVFRAISSVGDLAHSLNVSGAVVDEVHVNKRRDVIDALETGTGSRDQPLIVLITTADEGEDGSIYAEKRQLVLDLADGVIEDPSVYGVIYAADDDDDPFADETIVKANPGIGTSTTLEYLRGQARKARNSPEFLATYKRLHLGIRARARTRAIDRLRWDSCAGEVPDGAWRGRVVFGGLDLSSTTDTTAWTIVARDRAGRLMWRSIIWLPEERIDRLEDITKAPLRRWAAEGLLRLTEGNVVDYEQVRRDIRADLRGLRCGVDSVGYDPYNATETILRMEEDGLRMVPIRQGYLSLSPPTKELLRLVRGSKPSVPLLLHGGHPVLRWQALAVETTQDQAGNVKFVKPDEGTARYRIDAMAAGVNAIDRMMRYEAGRRRGATAVSA